MYDRRTEDRGNRDVIGTHLEFNGNAKFTKTYMKPKQKFVYENYNDSGRHWEKNSYNENLTAKINLSGIENCGRNVGGGPCYHQPTIITMLQLMTLTLTITTIFTLTTNFNSNSNPSSFYKNNYKYKYLQLEL